MSLVKGQKITRQSRVIEPHGEIEQAVYALIYPAYTKAPTKLQIRLISSRKKIQAIIRAHVLGKPLDPRIKSYMSQRIGAGPVQLRTPLWVIAKQFCPSLQAVQKETK